MTDIGTYQPGEMYSINGSGDLYMLDEARPFIGKNVRIVQRNKGGTYQVELSDGRRWSFAKRNLSPPVEGAANV